MDVIWYGSGIISKSVLPSRLKYARIIAEETWSLEDKGFILF